MEHPTTNNGKSPRRRKVEPAERLARAQEDLAAAKRAVAAAEQRRWTVIGRAVLAEASGNPEFMAQLRGILRARVTQRTGLEDVAGILDVPPAAAG